jgi:hypothetical protein
MNEERFERNVVGQVALDICYPCNAIWFDPLESSELMPGSIIGLLRQIHQHRNAGRRLLSAKSSCPVCARILLLANDLQRSGRFSYYRCPEGHGRLTSFFQFRREKQFVRSLTAVALSGLKAKVVQVPCSGYGASVDLQKDTACSYCRSPVSVLDPDAVEKMLQELQDKEKRWLTRDSAGLGNRLVDTGRGKRPGGLATHYSGPGRQSRATGLRLICLRLPFHRSRERSSAASSLLKFVASAGQARRKAAKKRNVWGVYMSILSRFPTLHHQAQQNFNKLLDGGTDNNPLMLQDGRPGFRRRIEESQDAFREGVPRNRHERQPLSVCKTQLFLNPPLKNAKNR